MAAQDLPDIKIHDHEFVETWRLDGLDSAATQVRFNTQEVRRRALCLAAWCAGGGTCGTASSAKKSPGVRACLTQVSEVAWVTLAELQALLGKLGEGAFTPWFVDEARLLGLI